MAAFNQNAACTAVPPSSSSTVSNNNHQKDQLVFNKLKVIFQKACKGTESPKSEAELVHPLDPLEDDPLDNLHAYSLTSFEQDDEIFKPRGLYACSTMASGVADDSINVNVHDIDANHNVSAGFANLNVDSIDSLADMLVGAEALNLSSVETNVCNDTPHTRLATTPLGCISFPSLAATPLGYGFMHSSEAGTNELLSRRLSQAIERFISGFDTDRVAESELVALCALELGIAECKAIDVNATSAILQHCLASDLLYLASQFLYFCWRNNIPMCDEMVVQVLQALHDRGSSSNNDSIAPLLSVMPTGFLSRTIDKYEAKTLVAIAKAIDDVQDIAVASCKALELASVILTLPFYKTSLALGRLACFERLDDVAKLAITLSLVLASEKDEECSNRLEGILVRANANTAASASTYALYGSGYRAAELICYCKQRHLDLLESVAKTLISTRRLGAMGFIFALHGLCQQRCLGLGAAALRVQSLPFTGPGVQGTALDSFKESNLSFTDQGLEGVAAKNGISSDGALPMSEGSVQTDSFKPKSSTSVDELLLYAVRRLQSVVREPLTRPGYGDFESLINLNGIKRNLLQVLPDELDPVTWPSCIATLGPEAYGPLVDACLLIGDLNAVFKVLDYLASFYGSPPLHVVATILKCMCLWGNFAAVIARLSKMKADVIGYNNAVLALERLDHLVDFGLATAIGALDFDAAASFNKLTKQTQKISPEVSSVIQQVPTLLTHRSQTEAFLSLCERLSLDEASFAIVLDCCLRLKNSKRLLRLVNKFRRTGVQPQLQTYGVIIKSLGCCGRINECKQIWNEMTVLRGFEPNEVTYGIMLDALVNNNGITDAMALFNEMKSRGTVKPNTIMYTTLIKGFGQNKQLGKAMKIYNLMCREQVERNTVTYNSIINACARVGDMKGATAFLEEMLVNQIEPDLITFSTIIKGYCVQSNMDQSFQLLGIMYERGIMPDGILYNSLLEGCVKSGRLWLCEKLWDQMQQHGIAPSNFTLTILIKMYGRSGQLDKVFELVGRLPVEYNFTINAHVYTCLMSACITNQRYSMALDIYSCMKSAGIKPDAKTFETLIQGATRGALYKEAAHVIQDILDADSRPPGLSGGGSSGLSGGGANELNNSTDSFRGGGLAFADSRLHVSRGSGPAIHGSRHSGGSSNECGATNGFRVQGGAKSSNGSGKLAAGDENIVGGVNSKVVEAFVSKAILQADTATAAHYRQFAKRLGR